MVHQNKKNKIKFLTRKNLARLEFTSHLQHQPLLFEIKMLIIKS
jgi:hypothetical protein